VKLARVKFSEVHSRGFLKTDLASLGFLIENSFINRVISLRMYSLIGVYSSLPWVPSTDDQWAARVNVVPILKFCFYFLTLN